MEYNILENFKFDISISDTRLASKPSSKKVSQEYFSTTKWIKNNIDIDTFENKIKDGHSFCYCFNMDTVNTHNKTIENFNYTNFIAFDIDHSNISLSQFLHTIPIEPTLSYTTFSSTFNNYRYRLIYLFDTPINGVSTYKNQYDQIKESLSLPIETDNCMRSPNQIFYGSSATCECYKTYKIYKLPKLDTEKSIKTFKTRKYKDNYIESYNIKYSEEFYNDFQHLPRDIFFAKYEEQYGLPPKESPLIYADPRYSIYPSPYYVIPRKYISERKENRLIRKSARWEDGEKRHLKIYTATQIWKEIVLNITPEQLLYYALAEIAEHYNNEDGKFSNQYMLLLVRTVWYSQCQLKSYPHPKFRINKDYCIMNRVSPNHLKGIIQHKIHYEDINKVYQIGVSDKDNLANLHRNNIKCSRRTLSRFKKEFGYASSKKLKKKE